MAEDVLRDLNLSADEMSRMSKALKDPTFMELLGEYAKEISDPANKEEADAYIKLAEDRQRFSMEGKQLIIPNAAFVVKTKNMKTGNKVKEGDEVDDDDDDDVSLKQQVFINVCYTDNIAKPSVVAGHNKSGEQWSIPYSLGPAKKDSDKSGGECEVHDFVVNEEAHQRATKETRFKRFLAETAIENVEKQRNVELERNFVLPKMSYKGGNKTPKMLTVPLECSSSPSGKMMKSSHSTQRKEREVEVEPSYEFVYRENLELSNFWCDESAMKKGSRRPKAIVMRVSLPNVVSASEVELDVSGNDVRLRVPGKYKLAVKTAYEVDFANGKAQFDKTKSKLQLVMPLKHNQE